MPPAPLGLRLFGPPTIDVGGEPAHPEVHWRKHVALLAWLALADGRRATRAALQALLWPDDDARARRSLNEAVRRLRGHLGRARICTFRDLIALETDGLHADVLDPPPATGTFRTPFLEGIDYADTPDFEEWVGAQRARFAREDMGAVLAAAGRCAASGVFERAVHLSGAVLARDPLHGGAVRIAMEALVLSGRRDEALDTWRRYGECLRAEGGAAPDDLSQLARRISATREPPEARREPPMVGRRHERAALTRAIEHSLDGVPTLALITGDVGSGRSRLLDACAGRAAIAGARCVRVRAVPDDGAAPWSLLRALLRAGLVGCPGVLAVPPSLLGVLAWFAPGLAERVSPRPPSDEGEVADALASLLRGVGDEQPLFVAVDDADRADAASLEAIRLALAEVRDVPVTVGLTAKPLSAATPAALLNLAASLGRDVAGVRIELEPLTPEETGELVDGMAEWCTAGEDRSRLARRLYHETGGDPLMSVTLLEALQDLAGMRHEMLRWPAPQHTLESPLPMAVPAVLRMAMLGRVAALPPGDRHILGVAAADGVRPAPRLVARRVGLDEQQVEAALVRLERARLVISDSDGFAFPAPLYAELLAHECLTPGERRALTRRPDRVSA